MGATFATIGTFFAADAGAAALAETTTAGLVAAGATAGEAAIAGSALAGTAATGAVAGGSLAGTLGTAAASAVAGQVAGKLLGPKLNTPTLPAPVEMPDPLAQQEAAKKSLVEQMARRGRASTVLTNSGSNTLGG